MNAIMFYPEVYEIARFNKKRKEFPPFGVLYLAAVLENIGIKVNIQKITTESNVFDLKDFDIILYSLSSSCTYNMMLESRRISFIKNNSIIITGGIHASIYPKQTLLDFQCDATVLGEGEETLPKVIYSIVNKIYEPILGVIYNMNIYNMNIHNYNLSMTNPIKDLDSLPFPARHLIPQEDFIFNDRLSRKNLKMTHILASRGCPYSCYFCGGLNKKHRYRSSQSIFNELKMLNEQYNIEGFVINDENFIINEKK